ncbi:basic leucine zipper 19-like [Phragmites australis]|uniref:basic leucine zipper 19-like n=1 Tax=Phragmites australis TaxID=29695 RepID=UPI002D767726|nr:basic leucine zipper 19-like [Phragmites australis]
MDDEEADLSSQIFFSNPETSTTLDDFLQTITATCTHSHTCNPPGSSATAHNHTCYHTHIHVSGTDEVSCASDKAKPKKAHKPLGNREAVHKYREKKKAHTTYLEEEVKKLRVINQQLLKKLQGMAALEAEVRRLKTLLIDVRAKIDGALGNYPFQTQCVAGDGLSCDGMAQCFVVKGVSGSCEPAVMNCHVNPDSGQNLGMPN